MSTDNPRADVPTLAATAAAAAPESSARAGSGRDAIEHIRLILAQHGRLSVPVNQLADHSDLHGAGLTSLATVGLMLALEEAFDIEFPDSMLSRRTFSSIDALAAAVDRLRAG